MKIKPGAPFKVTLDKATINIAIPEEQQSLLLSKVNSITAALKKQNPNFKNYGAHGYKETFKLPLGNQHDLFPAAAEAHIYVQVKPWDAKKSFMRIELNGHPYTKEQYKCAALWLELLTGELGLESSAFKVTRFDIAVDTLQSLSRLAIDHPSSKSSIKCFNPKGQKSTFYIGDKSSDLQICCYELNGQYKTRLEFRFRHKVQLPLLLEDNQWQSSFSQLKVYDMDKVKKSQMSEFSPWMLENICDNGLKAVMSKLTPKERKKLTQKLTPHQLKVYKPEKVQSLARRRLAWLVAAMTNDFSGLNLPDEETLERCFDKAWSSLTKQMKR